MTARLCRRCAQQIDGRECRNPWCAKQASLFPRRLVTRLRKAA